MSHCITQDQIIRLLECFIERGDKGLTYLDLPSDLPLTELQLDQAVMLLEGGSHYLN